MTSELERSLTEWLDKQSPTLFAGAGVGARLGYPNWPEYLEYLAKELAQHSPMAAQYMRECLKAGNYLYAAWLYKSNPDIPLGEKFSLLAAPFRKKYDTKPLHALINLRFSSIVTTNYDRSLLDASAIVRKQAPLTADLGDTTLGQAIFYQDYYVARIHGRAEVPDSIVLDEQDYSRTEANGDYKDFLVHTLTRGSCVFVGFSFVDPAIKRILQVIKARLSPNYPKQHLALLPRHEGSIELRQLLAQFNIKVLQYDPADNHAELWSALSAVSYSLKEKPSSVQRKEEPYLDAVKRFLATCYARIQLGPDIEPLRDSVLDGILLTIVQEFPAGAATVDTLAEKVKENLHVTDEEALKITDKATRRMLQNGWLKSQNVHFTVGPLKPKSYSEHIATLAESVGQRLEVRFSKEMDAHLNLLTRGIIEEVVARTGSQLCSSFAGGTGAGTGADIWGQISSATAVCCKDDTDTARKLSWSIWDLFRSPNKTEGIIITDLARVAFGVELILNSANLTLLADVPLPEVIYLDANVLMPAITEGHALQLLYVTALRRLDEALRKTGRKAQILVAEEFLEEVIGHRTMASTLVSTLKLENKEALRKHVLYHGAQRANVYVGAYASHLASSKDPLTFKAYLGKVAPYGTTAALSQFVKKQGIETVKMRFEKTAEINIYESIKSDLLYAYEHDTRSRLPHKPKHLIEHEARQLARLSTDLESGRRSLFVTADSRLRRLISSGIAHSPAHAVISRLAFVQLVDLLLGISGVSSALARSIWQVRPPDEMAQIRSYFTDLALRSRDEAVLQATNEVLDKLTPQIVDAAKAEGISLLYTDAPHMEETAKFLDRFEDQFFSEMQKVIRKNKGKE